MDRDAPSFLRYLQNHPNLLRVSSVVLFFVLWEIFGRDANPLFMTYPSAIGIAAYQITMSGELLTALKQSLVPLSIGLVISIIGGILIGVLMGQFWFIEYSIDPFVNALYAIPRIALVPLIILWAGLGVVGKIVILVSIAIFPVIINTYSGIKDVRGSLIEIGTAYSATRSQTFFKIILPASIPFIMTGIRLSVGLAIIGLVVAEFFTAISGLGGLITNYANIFATAKVFVPIIVIALLGVILTEVVMRLERRFSAWRVLERER